MTGRHRGFIAHLKREVPDLFTIYCVIHRQHLVSKHLSDRLQSTLQAVIRAVGTSAKFSPRQQQVQNFPQLVIKFILKNIRTASNPASTN